MGSPLCSFFAEEFQPRTKEAHVRHCQNLGGPLHDHVATTYGIHHNSIFRFYHVTEGLPPDIMHDILEGVLQYEVKELLKYLIKEKCFTLDTLNTRIELFPYVQPEKNNKPIPISSETLKSSHHNLKQTGVFLCVCTVVTSGLWIALMLFTCKACACMYIKDKLESYVQYRCQCTSLCIQLLRCGV